MTEKKNYYKEIITMKKIITCMLTVVTLITCMVLPASAATTSSGTNTRTITVVTKSNWSYPGSESITISQSKGKFSYSKTNWRGQVTGSTSKTSYGTWKISVAATDGTHSFSKTLSGGSIKLNLKSNKTYKITVSYDGNQDVFRGLEYRNFKWTSYPSWRVSSTWKCSACY